MDTIKQLLVLTLCGLKDSFCGVIAIKNYDWQTNDIRLRRSGNTERPRNDEKWKLLIRIFQCIALNGGVFGLFIFVFNNAILPNVRLAMNFFFSSSPDFANYLWMWVQPSLTWIFNALWILPLYILSRVINCLWFQDIANLAFEKTRRTPQVTISYSNFIADILFSVLIQALFYLQSGIVSLLPIPAVGWLLSLIHSCLLYSLYAFEYKWINMGWQLHKRLSFIESNWPYFIGFGFPLALLTSISNSYILNVCLFSVCFPFYIVSSNNTIPVTGLCYHLRIFTPVIFISNVIFRITTKARK